MLSPFGVPTTRAKVAWASAKRYFASLGLVMALRARAMMRESSGERGERAVVSVVEEVRR